MKYKAAILLTPFLTLHGTACPPLWISCARGNQLLPPSWLGPCWRTSCAARRSATCLEGRRREGCAHASHASGRTAWPHGRHGESQAIPFKNNARVCRVYSEHDDAGYTRDLVIAPRWSFCVQMTVAVFLKNGVPQASKPRRSQCVVPRIGGRTGGAGG